MPGPAASETIARVRRLAPWDRALLVGVLGVYVICAALALGRAFGGGVFQPPFHAAPAPEPTGYPAVIALIEPSFASVVEVEVGDLLVRAGERDLVGARGVEALAAAIAATDGDGTVRLTVLRDGEPREARIQRPRMARWTTLASALGFVLAGALALLGGGSAPGPRYFFLACAAIALHQTWFFGGSEIQTYASFFTYALGGVLITPLALLSLLHFPTRAPPAPALRRVWVWLFLVPALGYPSLSFGVPLRAEVGVPLAMAGNLAACAALLGVVAVRYRRGNAAVRRRLRWVGIGMYLGLAPLVAASAAVLWNPALMPVLLLSNLALLAVPICFLIAIAGFNAFDVDRLIGATATYTITFLLLATGVVVGAPVLAERIGGATGLGTEPAHVALALGVGALVAPLHRRLRPRIDGLFFPERQALAAAIERLRQELAARRDADDLVALLGEQLAALLRPERCAVCVRENGDFELRFASGSPGADFGAWLHPLLPFLVERTQPLSLEEGQLGASPLAPETRAELRARGIAVALPIRRGDALAAVVLLGPKRSTDVYTPTDLLLLESVCDRAGVALLRVRNAELDATSRAEHEANLAKSRFLAAASHDLRQPLHALGLFVGALAPRVRDPEAAGILDKIRRSTDQLEELFNAVLEVSKLDAGVVQAEIRDVPLAPLFAQLADELGPEAERKGLALRVAATRAVVRSDPLLLARIVRNLVLNAIRYTEQGRVLLGCRRAGGALRIEVWDTGPGISEADRAEVFREFKRLDAGAAKAEGAGLGLAIVERLCRLLGHTLELRSAPGAGSVFRVTAARGRAPLRSARIGGDVAGSPLAGRTILVVDDDPAIREAMRELLSSWGCAVLAAGSGASARAVLATLARAPDVLVVDYALAGETGLDVVDQIRGRLGRAVPAVIVTGDTSPDVLAATGARGLPVLSKPVPPARLRAALVGLLQPGDAR